MARVVIIVLVVLLAGLQYTLWFGDGGWRDMNRMQAQVEAQVAENGELARRNEMLAAEVEDLKQGSDAIEGRAREDLGLIKPGEIFYQVVGPPAAPDVQP